MVARYFPFLVRGVGITIEFTFISFLLAIVLGLVIALGRISENRFIRIPCQIYIDFIRGTPLLAQIYLVHFGLPQIFGYKPVGFVDALIALTLNSSAYGRDLQEWNRVNRGRADGSCQIARDDLWPGHAVCDSASDYQAGDPSMGNEFITLLKESSLMSVIGMEDLMMRAKMMAGRSFRPFELTSRQPDIPCNDLYL